MPRFPSDKSPDRPAKRRRLSFKREHKSAPLRDTGKYQDLNDDISIPGMADKQIQLGETERALRHLLLDVAEYIKTRTHNANGKAVKAPESIELRFTGGWVRDKLLGVESHDIDVAISTMTGFQFAHAMKEYVDVPGQLQTYAAEHPNVDFGKGVGDLHKIMANPDKSKHLETVTTRVFGLDLDFVNLRKEIYDEVSRNPQMEFGTPEEDALRRDATVNALFYNLHTNAIEDFTKRGLEDMKKGIIRTPLEPYQTFKDDPLRVLRLLRFSSRLGYEIDREAEIAMGDERIKEALCLKISRERVGVEVTKMLRGPDPHRALTDIDRLGLYETIFPPEAEGETVDLQNWKLVYNGLSTFLDNKTSPSTKDVADRLRAALVRDDEELFLCWLLACFAPWAAVEKPQPQKGKKADRQTTKIARNSIRLDNKRAVVIEASTRNYKHIIELKDSLLKRLASNADIASLEACPPDIRVEFGTALRTWGPSYRSEILFALLQELQTKTDLEELITSYGSFTALISALDLTEVCTLKALINGKDMAKEFGAKPGPWMTKAVDMLILWQLRHPGSEDKVAAMESLKQQRGELGL